MLTEGDAGPEAPTLRAHTPCLAQILVPEGQPTAAEAPRRTFEQRLGLRGGVPSHAPCRSVAEVPPNSSPVLPRPAALPPSLGLPRMVVANGCTEDSGGSRAGMPAASSWCAEHDKNPTDGDVHVHADDGTQYVRPTVKTRAPASGHGCCTPVNETPVN